MKILALALCFYGVSVQAAQVLPVADSTQIADLPVYGINGLYTAVLVQKSIPLTVIHGKTEDDVYLQNGNAYFTKNHLDVTRPFCKIDTDPKKGDLLPADTVLKVRKVEQEMFDLPFARKHTTLRFVIEESIAQHLNCNFPQGYFDMATVGEIRKATGSYFEFFYVAE